MSAQVGERGDDAGQHRVGDDSSHASPPRPRRPAPGAADAAREHDVAAGPALARDAELQHEAYTLVLRRLGARRSFPSATSGQNARRPAHGHLVAALDLTAATLPSTGMPLCAAISTASRAWGAWLVGARAAPRRLSRRPWPRPHRLPTAAGRRRRSARRGLIQASPLPPTLARTRARP